MDEKKLQALYKALKKEPLIQKYMYQYTWISGSSTTVYPITFWENSVCVQIKIHKNVFEKFIKRFVAKHSDLVIAGNFNRNDGSCPPELQFWYNVPQNSGYKCA